MQTYIRENMFDFCIDKRMYVRYNVKYRTGVWENRYKKYFDKKY